MTTKTDERGPNEAQRALWNGNGGRAWVETQTLMDTVLEPFEAILVAAATDAGAQSVLDVGCGCGATTLAVARRLGAGARVVGIDVSAAMIARARARADAEDLPVAFVCGDAQVAAFDPPGFDLVVSRFGTMFFDDPVAAFRRIASATRPEGRLCAIAWRSPAENPFMTAAERAAAPWLPPATPPPPESPGPFAFADAARTADKLRAAGWHAVEAHPLDVACALPEDQLTTYLTWMGPVGRALQDVTDPGLRAEVLTTVRAAFAPWIRDGALRFDAACWRLTARAG